jgi:LysM repeat protein
VANHQEATMTTISISGISVSGISVSGQLSTRASARRPAVRRAVADATDAEGSSVQIVPSAPAVPSGKARIRLTRRGRVVVALLVVLPLAVGGTVLGAGSLAIADGQSASTVRFEHVTVQNGESLWTIAQHIAPNVDPRDVIAAIVDLNGLSSASVQPGQRLAIPSQYASHAG